MDTIRLVTWINAPVERCFKLSASVDLHVASAAATQEEVVGGVGSGLIGEGQTVTFRGRHFGLKLRHTSRIEAWRPYSFFRDVMVDGHFQRFEHDHHFAPMDDGTRIRDEIRFSLPWGALGRLVAKRLVRRHLTGMFAGRNEMIKRVAESEEWHRYLDGGQETKSDAAGESQRMRTWSKSSSVGGAKV